MTPTLLSYGPMTNYEGSFSSFVDSSLPKRLEWLVATSFPGFGRNSLRIKPRG
jgi:hypothetical protein